MVAETQDLQEKIVKYLLENGIATRPFFWCMHEQPIFKKLGLFKNESYPNAEKIARNGFYLPSGLGLKDDEVDFIIKKMQDFNAN